MSSSRVAEVGWTPPIGAEITLVAWWPTVASQVLEGRGRQARGPWGKGSARAVAVKMTTGHRPREAGKPGTGLAGAWEEWVRDTFVPASDSGQG